MKKIPTLFQRDPQNPQRVIDAVTPGCEWVLEGLGVATEKIDGTCCLIRDGRLYKRRMVKPGQEAPPDFEEVDSDPATGKRFGWVPVRGEDPEDQYHWEALTWLRTQPGLWAGDGSYELVGPKVQGNKYNLVIHLLWKHGSYPAPHSYVLSFDGLREALETYSMEGIVWHHPDGRMAKIKARDFGLKW